MCSYDEFSENSYMNKIIKTTIMLLLRSDISNTFKKELRKVLVFLKMLNFLTFIVLIGIFNIIKIIKRIECYFQYVI